MRHHDLADRGGVPEADRESPADPSGEHDQDELQQDEIQQQLVRVDRGGRGFLYPMMPPLIEITWPVM